MRNFLALIPFSLFAVLGHAQQAATDAALLSQARAAYDAPFNSNLQSFECAVEFNWMDHFKEAPRLGDEGTDEEIKKDFEPLRNRVTVTKNGATVSSGLTDETLKKLAHGAMFELLLEHAVQFSLNNWLVASNNALLPRTGTPVHFEPSTSGYQLGLKIKTFDVVMMLTHDMSLQSMGVKGSDSDRQEFEFHAGPQGFVLGSWTMGENGDFRPGNRIILTYTYQTVSGFQLPDHVAINRESHHEVWHYKLTGCTVQTAK